MREDIRKLRENYEKVEGKHYDLKTEISDNEELSLKILAGKDTGKTPKK